MAEVVTVYDGSDGVCCLSLAVIVATCAYPKDVARREGVFAAFASWLEASGYSVELTAKSGLHVRPKAWTMTERERDRRIRAAAARLRRRLAAVFLDFLRTWRPRGMGIDKVYHRFHQRRWGRSTDAAANNVRTVVWGESLPVLHLVYAIKAELDREGMPAEGWPALCTMQPQERLARVLRSSELWRLSLQRQPIGAPEAGGVSPLVQIRVTLPDGNPIVD